MPPDVFGRVDVHLDLIPNGFNEAAVVAKHVRGRGFSILSRQGQEVRHRSGEVARVGIALENLDHERKARTQQRHVDGSRNEPLFDPVMPRQLAERRKRSTFRRRPMTLRSELAPG